MDERPVCDDGLGNSVEKMKSLSSNLAAFKLLMLHSVGIWAIAQGCQSKVFHQTWTKYFSILSSLQELPCDTTSIWGAIWRGACKISKNYLLAETPAARNLFSSCCCCCCSITLSFQPGWVGHFQTKLLQPSLSLESNCLSQIEIEMTSLSLPPLVKFIHCTVSVILGPMIWPTQPTINK